MKTLDLYITKVCNLDCEYCYVDVVKKEDTLFPTESLYERKNLLDYDVIKFFGGEPLVRWEMIQEIVTQVRKKKAAMKFTIVTNGILLSEKKSEFILEQDIGVVISIHAGSFDPLKKKISVLQKLGNNAGFYIIFDPKNFNIALKNFLFFSKHGFRNYCFAPEIYGDWDESNLQKLERLLETLLPYILKYNMNISGIPHDTLKLINRGCEKTVIDETGTFKPCNRFKALEKKEKFSYKEVYDGFDGVIGYDSDPLRWFYICPVGWFLDNQNSEDFERSIRRFKKLNHVFIAFYRKIHANKLCFISENIDEIRFNLTQQCNLRCEYCYIDFKNKTIDIPTANNISSFFLEQEGEDKYISFFGGEPLLEFPRMKKIVEYANLLGNKLGKKVHYQIATNFTIMTDEIIDFLRENNFTLHISINGGNKKNNILRDNSSEKLFHNIKEFLSEKEKKEVCVLYAFGPTDVIDISENIKLLIDQGFQYFNFELIFGKKYNWTPAQVEMAVKIIDEISKKKQAVKIKNLEQKKRFLDINTDGNCAENSLEFFGANIHMQAKNHFDTLLQKMSF